MTLRVQEVQAGAELPTVKHHSFTVTSASFSPAELASVAQTEVVLRKVIACAGPTRRRDIDLNRQDTLRSSHVCEHGKDKEDELLF
jgi:hypothetical protein